LGIILKFILELISDAFSILMNQYDFLKKRLFGLLNGLLLDSDLKATNFDLEIVLRE
jgi:hypothetical protein